MPEPVVFVSHFRVKEGRLPDFARSFVNVVAQLQPTRRGTLLFEAYAGEGGSTATILHVFADADAMDRHFEGADERSRAAYELIEPQGWEIYGQASPTALRVMEGQAAAAGVSLSVQASPIGGFLRLAPAGG